MNPGSKPQTTDGRLSALEVQTESLSSDLRDLKGFTVSINEKVTDTRESQIRTESELKNLRNIIENKLTGCSNKSNPSSSNSSNPGSSINLNSNDESNLSQSLIGKTEVVKLVIQSGAVGLALMSLYIAWRLIEFYILQGGT